MKTETPLSLIFPRLQKAKEGNGKKACVCVRVCLGECAHTTLEFFIHKQAWWRRDVRLLGHREKNPREGFVEGQNFLTPDKRFQIPLARWLFPWWWKTAFKVLFMFS